MSKDERLLNLVVLLKRSTRPLSKSEIRRTIEGYRDADDGNFDRTFERDKAELRQQGIHIQVHQADPLFLEEDSYSIDDGDYELPPMEFTQREISMLASASFAWSSSQTSQAVSSALGALAAGGAPIIPGDTHSLRPQLQVEPCFDAVVAAQADRRVIQFTYRGKTRRIQPWKLRIARGQSYVIGLDLDAQQVRHYKLSRFESEVIPRGKAHAFTIPDEIPLEEAATQRPTAVVALHDDAPTELRSHASAVEMDGLPPEFTAWHVSASTEWLLADEIAALGEHAIVISPAAIRELVIARLRRCAEGWQG